MSTSLEILLLIVDLTLLGLSHDIVAKQLHIAKNTVIKYLRKYNIINPKYEVKEITPELLDEIQLYYKETRSSKKVIKKFHISFARLRKYIVFEKSIKKEVIKKPKDNSKRNKLALIEYKGGHCLICGYNKCYLALEFHHIDPSKKDFSISGGTKSLYRLKTEVDKCLLVCSNCHREIHAGLINIRDFV